MVQYISLPLLYRAKMFKLTFQSIIQGDYDIKVVPAYDIPDVVTQIREYQALGYELTLIHEEK